MEIGAFPEGLIVELAEVLAQAASHSELTDIFAARGIEAPGEHQGGKAKRIRKALLDRQTKDGHGSEVAAFVCALLDPARYAGKPAEFDELRSKINALLGTVDLELSEKGRLHSAGKRVTLAGEDKRAKALMKKLRQRRVHPDLLKFCKPEILKGDYFHAMLEAVKSVAQKIREKTALSSDGAELAEQAFGGARPRLAINRLANESERSERRGFQDLLVGIFGTFRNPIAHAPRGAWPISEEDTLDLLSFLSYVHRRLDRATAERGGSV